MRILVLNYEFPPVGGGGGRVAEDICYFLAQRGHDIRVITAYVKGLPKIESKNGYQILRIFSFRQRQETCTVWEMAFFLVFALYPALKQAITWKPEIVHVHFAVPTGVLAYLVNRITHIPYVLTIHLGDVPGGVPEQTDRLFRIIKPLTVPIWHRAAAIIAVSNFIRELALKSYDVTIETLFNGIALHKYQQNALLVNHPKHLVFVGRFDQQKNLLFLLEVLASIYDLEWKMDMLGDGPLMQSIQQQLQQTNLTKKVKLHGWVEQTTVDTIMSQADILVLPSISEGMPVVGAMALAQGLAILGSDIGGLADIVKPGVNGLLCPVNNHDAFKTALKTMLTNDKLLYDMKIASKQYAHQFDIIRIIERYEEIFNSVRLSS
jgi:glycosyltransferase involved in cell wall biosynthesis